MQPVPQPSSQSLDDLYAKLLDDLHRAFLAANTPAAKAEIDGASTIVADALTALNGADLSARDAAFAAARTKVASANERLETLQQQISSMVSKVSTADAIVSDVTNVILAAGKIFKP